MFKDIVAMRAKYQSAQGCGEPRPRIGGGATEAARVFSETFTPAAKAYEGGVLSLLAMERKAIDEMSQAIDDANERSLQAGCAADRADAAGGRGLCFLHLAQHRAPPAPGGEGGRDGGGR
jgi:methyl-accepting chemotaxis protein